MTILTGKRRIGHYVNISLYKEDTDEVFLADPADPDGNRNYTAALCI